MTSASTYLTFTLQNFTLRCLTFTGTDVTSIYPDDSNFCLVEPDFLSQTDMTYLTLTLWNFTLWNLIFTETM